MDKKRIQNFRTRINKAKISFSIGTDFFLQMDIDHMSQADRLALQAGLLNSRKPLTYDYLDKVIAKNSEPSLETKALFELITE